MKSETSMRVLVSLAAVAAMFVFQGSAQAGGDPVAGKNKAAVCATCHGPDGNSPQPAFPKIAGQHADYLARTLMDYKTGARKNPIMAGFVATLSKEDMADLAAFFAEQKSDLYTVKYAD
jgi:cytochrome c553